MFNIIENLKERRKRTVVQPSESHTVVVGGPYGLDSSRAQLFLRLRPNFDFAYDVDEEGFNLLYDYLPPRLLDEHRAKHNGILMSVMVPESPQHLDGEVVMLKGVEVRLKKILSLSIYENGGIAGSRIVRHVIVYGYTPTHTYLG